MAKNGRVSGAQMERTEEFDAFGPWALTVRDTDEVPRLFRPLFPDPGAAAVVVKIPRTISRRDANPSMDLYDHLLVVHADRLEVLSRIPGQAGGVRTRSIGARAVLAVENSIDLLDGRLVVRAVDDKPISIRYNAVSKEVIAPVVAAIRALWRDGPPVEAGPVEDHTVPVGLRDLGEDVSLISEYRETVAAEPGMRLLGAHERRIVRPAEAGPFGRALHRLWPMWLQGAVVLSDGVELEVLHRRSWFVRGSRPVHSLARTVMPLARTAPVEVVPTAYEGVREIRVGHAAHFAVPSQSPTEWSLLEVLN